MPTFNSGAAIDTRTDAQKAKDWQQKEVVAATASVQWMEKPQSAWRKFPIFNQDGSGSCVMQTQCKEMGIMRYLSDGVYVHFSVADGYQRRANKPAPGMGADDARRIAASGVTLEVLAPSQNLSDAELDAATVESYKHQVGSVFSVPNHLALPTKNIDAIASTIQATRKGVMVWFYFLIDEWTEKPTVKYPSLDVYADTTARHSVTAVDYTLQGGEKCLIIEDSWGSSYGIAGQRVITESFFNARNWFADYLVNFTFQTTPITKPQYSFATSMQLNDQNADVKALQDCLRYDGEYPANADSTGFFGPITQKAVGAFQMKYGVVLTTADPGFGRAGPKTRAVLNALFGQ